MVIGDVVVTVVTVVVVISVVVDVAELQVVFIDIIKPNAINQIRAGSLKWKKY